MRDDKHHILRDWITRAPSPRQTMRERHACLQRQGLPVICSAAWRPSASPNHCFILPVCVLQCYTVTKPQFMSFKAANELCQTLRGSLFSIRDQAEQGEHTSCMEANCSLCLLYIETHRSDHSADFNHNVCSTKLVQVGFCFLHKFFHHLFRQEPVFLCLILSSDFITTLLPGKPKKLWIGLKDNRWVDNTSVNYHNFNPLIHGQLRLMHINASVPLFHMLHTIPVTITLKKKPHCIPSFLLRKTFLHSSGFFVQIFEQDSLQLCAYMFNDPHSDMLGTWDYTSCSDEQSVAICQHYAGSPSVLLYLLRYYGLVSRDDDFFFFFFWSDFSR